MASPLTKESSTGSTSTATLPVQIVHQGGESSTNRPSTLARVQSIPIEEQRARAPVITTAEAVGGGRGGGGGVMQGVAAFGDQGGGMEDGNQPVSNVLP